MKKWFTQPEKTVENKGVNFSSFYYYDDDKKNKDDDDENKEKLVRIRLELKREKHERDDGSTKVVKTLGVKVGFSKESYTKDHVKNFSFNEEKSRVVDHNGVVLSNCAEDSIGKYCYEFSYLKKEGKRKLSLIHQGNKVVESFFIPKDIDPTDLETLANKVMNSEKSIIVLTTSKASTQDLVGAIKDAIK